MTDLTARVVVVARADEDPGLAEKLADSGAAIVLCGRDGEALGALAGSLRARHGTRVAVYFGDPNDSGLAEMVAELFDSDTERDA